MSAILRNTLRFVGTAKCATNDSTKYLQTMPHMANRLNDLLALNGPNYLHHQSKRLYLNTRDTNNKLAYFEKSSNVGHFIVSLNSGKIRLLTDELFGRQKNITLPSTFITKLNGMTIEPESHEKKEEEEEETSYNFGGVNVSLDDGKLKLQRQDTGESLILPIIISPDQPGKKIKLGSHKPESKEEEEEEETSFNVGELDVSLDDGKLKLQVKNTGETFILSHAFHIEAQRKPPKTLEDGSIEVLNSPMYLCQCLICGPKIKTKTGLRGFSTPYTRKSTSRLSYITPWHSETQYKLHRPEFRKKLLEYKYRAQEDDDDELTVAPNKCGEMKLQFPMDVSLEGARNVIKIRSSDDFLNFYHTVDIKAYHEYNANNLKNRTSKIGKFAIQLESGDLLIEAREPCDRRINMKQEVRIIVDLDNAVPRICVEPYVMTSYSF
ncbi:hypothetical protein HCN44_006935 [Aphidius gifuensis]|uniref:Uncharacterized protein n=1 Tax=Aphidius gifuensis TaxID=684658 RepID=A0A834Y170_APHGI|nr:hypothetical protein HCN44_006935 [Aphidius gifuensis]